MKTNTLIIGLLIGYKINALVDFGPTAIITNVATNKCERFVKIVFDVNWQVNNDRFELWRSSTPDFIGSMLVTTISGCGTCGGRTYTMYDNNYLQPGAVYYYRIIAVSNWDKEQRKYIGYVSIPQSIDFVNQVTDQVNIGGSPSNENAYNWHYEPNKKQGVVISLYPTEIYNIYLEKNNFELIFKTTEFSQFVQIKASINNGNYFNVYNGPPIFMYNWINANSYFPNTGEYSLKIKFLTWGGKYYIREYKVIVVPPSDELYMDNYCNTIRVWKGFAGPGGFDGVPLILSEGFDPYNMKSQQYYRYAGNDLIECLLKKGFNVYIVNYSYNSQSIVNNAAVFSSAIRYVYSLNNKKVVATGISMGGIINRYACALAEQNGNPLPISKFVTIDSPHQGAILSKELQDWRKQETSGDVFAEHAINNPAAKQMLIYNPYDFGATHQAFYNHLKSINGDGYPHLVEKIGISFSTTQSNPSLVNTEWLRLEIKSNFNSKKYKSFYLSADEVVSGSFFPKFNVDPVQIYLISTNKWYLSPLQSISDPYLIFNQLAYPTFISHNSSLDIENNISKFDKVIVPFTTYFHDQIPSELIEQIVNALLQDYVYIQGKTYLNAQKNIVASKKIVMGDSVNLSIPLGAVRIINSDIHLKAGEEISILDDAWIEEGSDFSAIIVNPVVQCDNTITQQVMRINQYDIDNSSATSEVVEDYENTDDKLIVKDKSTLQIHPNPTPSYIHITMPEEDWNDLTHIYLITPLGVKTELPKSEIQDFSHLPNGMYFLQFHFSNGMMVVKNVIKQE